MKKISFMLGIFVVVVASVLVYGVASKNYSNENAGEMRIIKIEEMVNSSENKEKLLKNLDAKIGSIDIDSIDSINTAVISEINKKPNIVDVKIEKIVVKNKNMKRERVILLNFSINEKKLVERLYRSSEERRN